MVQVLIGLMLIQMDGAYGYPRRLVRGISGGIFSYNSEWAGWTPRARGSRAVIVVGTEI